MENRDILVINVKELTVKVSLNYMLKFIYDKER